jgi:hypothetical protein
MGVLKGVGGKGLAAWFVGFFGKLFFSDEPKTGKARIDQCRENNNLDLQKLPFSLVSK